ncbi:MAG: hypothetical protein ACE5F1_13125 [Planctomycetota bacterium]
MKNEGTSAKKSPPVGCSVDPIISCYYKSSRIKQYFKEGRALRTDLVICDSRDFGFGRLVNSRNSYGLRAVGDFANRRLCDDESESAMPAPDVDTFDEVTLPSDTDDGLHASGLRFGNQRVLAVMASTVAFSFVFEGFTNRQLVERVSALLGRDYTARQATNDLRRFRRKRIIERIHKTNRYQLTPYGRPVAVLFTKTYGRILAPGMTALDPALPDDVARRSPLAMSWHNFERALNDCLDQQLTAA